MPQVVLADRIVCLRGPVVAGGVLVHPDYGRTVLGNLAITLSAEGHWLRIRLSL